MKKIFTLSIVVFLTTICAVAQLPYNTNYSKDYFDSGTTTVNKKSASWDNSKKSIFGSERYNRLKLDAGGFDWNDKYVDIALSQGGVPHKLICTTSCSGAATDPYFYVATSVDNKTYTTQWSNTKGGTVEVELPKDANYVRLCYSGNLSGYYENIKVTELKYLNKPVGNFKVGEKAIKSSESSNGLTIDWCNISAIEASISGTDAEKFKVASISNNASTGNYGTAIINVTYSHNTLGTHTATLKLSGNGTSYFVTLTGTTTKKAQTITWDEQWNTPTIPIGKIVENAAKTISPLPIKYKSSNDTVIQIINDSTAFKAIAVGTATITAIQAGDDEWNKVSSEKEFTVTEKKIQTIVWNDNLTRLKTTDATQKLTAQVYIILNHETNEKEFNADRTALLKYESANTKVVSVSDTILTIVGEGETTLTASIEGDENYEATSVTVPVKVRQPSAGCEDDLLVNEPAEIEFYKMQANRDEIISDSYKIGAGVPGYLTFQYRGKKYWTGNFKGSIKAQQSTDNGNNWSDVAGSTVETVADESRSLTVQLDRRATHIRFVHLEKGEGYHYVSHIVVTPAQYLETSVSSITENAVVGDVITRDITINYSNVKDEVLIAHNEDVKTISLSKDGLGNDCGDFGSATFTVTIVPTELGTITDNIVISDAVSKMNVTIPVTVNVRRNTQTITWEDNLANIKTTDTITLTAYAETEVYYISSDSTIAYAEGNVLKINKHGQFTLTAVAVESEKYEQATLSKDITINAVQPTVSAWPTVEPIAYTQALTTDLLVGGKAEVEGYFDWNTERNQTLVPDTYDLPVRFMPTDTNYYAPVYGTVSVTINKSAQSIIWNDSFENITVSDSIVLTASAQTKVTYAVSDIELAYITDNNVLYFLRGGALQVTAYAEEDAYYLADTLVRELEILPAYPTIETYPTASPISYGQLLGESELSGGVANVSGTFAWVDPAAELEAGEYHQNVLFTPDDQVSYKNIEIPVIVLVKPIEQTITWELNTIEVRQGQSLQFNAVASSNLPITYSVDNNALAKVENNTFYALEVGEVVVTATQDGTYTDEDGELHANYVPAEPISKTIIIVPQQSPQTIVWNDDLSNVVTTDDITLSAIAQTPIHYLSSDSTIAYVEADKLIIKRFGTLTITAVAQQTEDYDQAILEKTLTIVAATPNVIAWPTVQPVTYGTKLNVNMLQGGEAKVDGYFEWNTDLSQEFVPGTYTLGVRFVPANLDIYATVLDSVEVIVNKAPQTIVWNNNFENVLVSDTIVLNASALTTITYEVSDIEVATLEGNILSFHRGGTINVTAYAAESELYLADTLVRELIVHPGDPIIYNWPTASDITYGQLLGESILTGGQASTDGIFEWVDPNETFEVGEYAPYVRFTPDDQASFAIVENQVEINVTPALQTIEWDLTDYFVIEVGDTLHLTAVATSGLEVTYTLDNEELAEISSNILIGLKVGMVTITASQSGVYVDEFDDKYANYLAAEPVSKTVTIVAKDINTGADMIFNEVQAAKVIRDGRLYIIRNGHIYNANGQVIE